MLHIACQGHALVQAVLMDVAWDVPALGGLAFFAKASDAWSAPVFLLALPHCEIGQNANDEEEEEEEEWKNTV